MSQTPLFRLFNTLRQQAHMGLGIDDYLIAMEALQQGYGLNGRDDLCEMCQVLWVTSEEERHLFLSIFNELFPPPAAAEEPQQPDTEPDEKASEADQTEEQDPDEKTDDKETPPRPEKSTDKTPEPAVSDQQLATTADMAQPDEIESFVRNPQPDSAAGDSPQAGLGIEFLPVTARQMKQSFRRLRQTVREGPLDELDIEKTVDEIAHNGILLTPAMRARRVNRASLFLLVDQGGSMGPFHPLSRRLIETAERGSRLRKMSAYYFRNYPANHLFSDAHLVNETAVERVFHEIERHRAAVLIFSDAGAARGFYNKARVNWTFHFVSRLSRFVRHVTWLNPMPVERWANSSAATIARFVPMYSVNQKGMEQAVGALRG